MYGVELRLQYYCETFKIYLRSFRRFYGAYLFSKNPNSILEILIDCQFWRDNFVLLQNQYAL